MYCVHVLPHETSRSPLCVAGAARLKLERLYRATGIIYESLPSLAERAVRRGPYSKPLLGRLPLPPGSPSPEVSAEIWEAQVCAMRLLHVQS